MTLPGLAAKVEAAEGPDRAILDRLDRSGTCWLWLGPLDARGRGRVWRGGKIMLHHRAVWEILVGTIPDGKLLCHHCDNPRCANPEHLYVGDGKSNVADMFRRGRAWQLREPERVRDSGRRMGQRNTWCRGAQNPKAKLTPEQVSQIKASKVPTKQLASQYGVNRTTIQRARSGKQWK